MKKFIFVPDKTSPLIFIDLSFKTGSIFNPKGKNSLCALTVDMLLRGTKKKKASKFHEILEILGAEIHASQSIESTHIRGEVLKENLKPFLELFIEMISQPDFSSDELGKAKKQLKAALKNELSSDGKIANRRLQEYLFYSHPYGQLPRGNISSIDSITREDLKKFHANYLSANAALLSITGNLSRAKMQEIGNYLISGLPKAPFTAKKVISPTIPKGHNLLILNKKDCSQSRIFIASKGITQKHPEYHALDIASHAFGGSSFSAWMMQEIREKRGWSYGAYSSYFYYKQPLYYKMWTTPSNKNTAGALSLMLDLLEKLNKKGFTKDEFEFAKKSLINQNAFSLDTPKKKMYRKVEEILFDLPSNYYKEYRNNLKKQSYKRVQDAIRRNFDVENLFIVILGTSNTWKKEVLSIKKLKLNKVKSVSYEKEASPLFT